MLFLIRTKGLTQFHCMRRERTEPTDVSDAVLVSFLYPSYNLPCPFLCILFCCQYNIVCCCISMTFYTLEKINKITYSRIDTCSNIYLRSFSILLLPVEHFAHRHEHDTHVYLTSLIDTTVASLVIGNNSFDKRMVLPIFLMRLSSQRFNKWVIFLVSSSCVSCTLFLLSFKMQPASQDTRRKQSFRSFGLEMSHVSLLKHIISP